MKMNKAYILPIGGMLASFAALSAISRMLSGGRRDGGNGGQNADTDGGKKQSKREVADRERKKVMSELGKKGAAKRWKKEESDENQVDE